MIIDRRRCGLGLVVPCIYTLEGKETVRSDQQTQLTVKARMQKLAFPKAIYL